MTMQKIKLLIVDDHQLVREGISAMLKSQEKKYLFSIEEVANAEDAITKARNNRYDLIIMDYQLPKLNGLEATKSILVDNPRNKILVVSNYDEYMQVATLIKAGVKGFVLKNISPEELVTAIETILSGKNYYSNDIAVKLINFKEDAFAGTVLSRMQNHALSKRELEVLKLIALENTNEEIATKLFISRRTVDTHRQNLLNKLNAKNSVGLVRYAIDLNILK